jgi:hypothetical protein
VSAGWDTGEVRNVYKILIRKPEGEGTSLQKLGIDGRII